MAALSSEAADRFVWTGGADTPPYASWATAAHKIEAAVAVARSGDTVWVTNGTYGVADEIAVGRAVTVRSLNGNDGNTIIDGGGATRCVNLMDEGAKFDGFVLRNGKTSECGGGALLCPGAMLVNCTVISNAAAYGGGVHLLEGGRVANCTIALNRAVGPRSGYAGGGGVYMVNGGALVACRVYGNDAGGSPGGGVNCGMDCAVLGGTVSSNLAGRGGGIYCSGQALVSNVLVVGNVCSNGLGGGGGVSLLYRARLVGSTVAGNRDDDTQEMGGGGVKAETGSVVSDCAIYGNDTANGTGGGVLLGSGCEISGSTLASNRAWRGGGVYAAGGGSIVNCRIRGNVAVNDWGGGGAYAENNSATVVRNCLIAENESISDYVGSGGGGGGVWMGNGALLDRCTIVRNRARAFGGGIRRHGGIVSNSIVCFNTAGSIATNICSGFTNFFNSCSPDLVDGVNGNVSAEPAFVDPGSGSGANAVPGDYRLRQRFPVRGFRVKEDVDAWGLRPGRACRD
ncbi:MAG: hypothetical protein PHR35_14000 [Kiritimatiellae bacterium]|nr:hypothetical protein [Kiritimatiellia bacterium]